MGHSPNKLDLGVDGGKTHGNPFVSPRKRQEIIDYKYKTESEFQEEINKLKHRSSRKFKDKWQHILEKYSAIDDDVESDEIDLRTGEITKNNGHLLSINRHHDVWAIDFDMERDQQRQKRQEMAFKARKDVLKQKLKTNNEFVIKSSPVKYEDIQSDDILLLGSKKFKVSPTKSIESFTVLESPTRRLKTHQESEESEDSDGLEELQEDPINSDQELKLHFEPNSSDIDDFDDQYLVITSPHLYIKLKPNAILSCCFKHCHYTTGNKLIFKAHLLESHRTELYFMGYPISRDEITTSTIPITQTMINSIKQHFPAIHEIPPLPLSADGKIFKCNLPMQNGHKTCQREFVSKHELNLHYDSYPFNCSYKTQVYVCPVLGCGFMTDESYFLWRLHFLDMNHQLEMIPRCVVVDDVVDAEASPKPLPIKDFVDELNLDLGFDQNVVDEINQLFDSDND